MQQKESSGESQSAVFNKIKELNLFFGLQLINTLNQKPMIKFFFKEIDLYKLKMILINKIDSKRERKKQTNLEKEEYSDTKRFL